MLPDWDYLEHLARNKKLPGFAIAAFSIIVGLVAILGVVWLV